MANRQYIGARYVPKFFENPNGSSEWLPNTTYEPLTIVTYGTNVYTAKISVPATIGNPAENIEYWCNIGLQNQQIVDIQKDISNINYKINVDGKILFIMDSYGGYTYNQKNFVEIACDYIGLEKGIDYKILYQGGAGFAASYKWVDLLKANPDIENPEDYSRIMVIGGANDAVLNETDVREAIGEFCVYCKTRFPNATIYAGALSKSLQYHETWYNAINWYHEVCKYGGYYLDNIEYCMVFSSQFRQDNVHPSNNFIAELGLMFVDWIKNNRGDVVNKKPYNLFIDGQKVGNGELIQHNNMVAIIPSQQYGGLFSFTVASASEGALVKTLSSDEWFGGSTQTSDLILYNVQAISSTKGLIGIELTMNQASYSTNNFTLIFYGSKQENDRYIITSGCCYSIL